MIVTVVISVAAGYVSVLLESRMRLRGSRNTKGSGGV